jgi:hypothetical protein
LAFEVKLESLSVVRFAFSAGSVAATCLAPKEDFTQKAERSTQNRFMRRGWRLSAMGN